uniref:Putative Werner Syndrome-like exonuclease n=1 Tax=Davidia involucrata TaxID=16924 RepID=A0A5B7BMQ8_DAVIN
MTISIRDFGLPYQSYRLYDVNFFDDTIKTLVTDTPCIVDTWISDMERLHNHRLHKLIVGLDIEWHHGPNPAATLQLCIGRNCLIFQLIFAPEIPQSLRDFLTDNDYTFVGVGIDKDVQKLYDDYGLDVSNTVDLGYLAASELGQKWLRSVGLVRLAREVLGKDFEKPKWVTLSDWDDDWLSLDQIQYACVDAFVSFEIGRCLNAGN